MIVSELCTNGDLFDYIRNVPPPSLYKVVSDISISLSLASYSDWLPAKHDA